MVGHHVAQGAGRVVVVATAADGQRFRDRDLDVVDVIAVPDRLKQAVGKTQHHDVLHRLLAEIVIDAEDLVFLENAKELVIERKGAGEIGAKRLFDDDAPPRTLTRSINAAVFPGKTGFAEMTANRRESGRWRGEVKQAIASGRPLGFDALKFTADLDVGGIVVGFALHIGDVAKDLLEHLLIDRPAGELRQALGEILAKGVVR